VHGSGRLRGVVALLCVIALGTAPARAAAAGDPPDPGSTQKFTYDSGGNAFPYIVYVPTSYDAARPGPLVVMTHGCQTTAEQQLRANLYNPVAEREGFVILYPDVDAVEAAQPGPTQRCWQFPNPASWHRGSGDAAAIAGMTRTVMARWRVDPERVYMVGMSAGSFMTSIMAAAYPDLFAAVAINAGGAYADASCLVAGPGIPVAQSAQLARDEMGARARIVPRLVMGGDADQGIPPACADKALEQGLRTNNLVLGDRQDAPISLKPASVREEAPAKPGGYGSTVRTYRDPAGCLIGERWLIHGMNHFWPGGTSDPKYKDFTDPKGPNGAEISWAFLSRYTKAATAMPCAEGHAPAAVVKRCKARWLTVRLPAGANGLRATVNGHAAAVRIVHGRARVRLPATRRTRTTVVVRGRTRAGSRFTRRHAYRGCGG
jgi:poly(hydroxyalkanoate) depolymerase family esterase